MIWKYFYNTRKKQKFKFNILSSIKNDFHAFKTKDNQKSQRNNECRWHIKPMFLGTWAYQKCFWTYDIFK